MLLVKCLCSKQQLPPLNSFHEKDSILLFKVSWNRGGDFLIKVGTDVRAWALGISGVNFCPGIRFDKRVKNVAYLLKIFNFGTLKVMKTCPVIRFRAPILPGHQVFGGNFARPRFCTLRTSVTTFIREPPPPSPGTFLLSPYTVMVSTICYQCNLLNCQNRTQIKTSKIENKMKSCHY